MRKRKDILKKYKEVIYMGFLVVGLGSMGKRRIRNLIACGVTDIVGLDVREDRRAEAEERFSIKTIKYLDELDNLSYFKAFIISVPPDRHMAFDNNISCFIEASVVDEGMKELLDKMKTNDRVKICPSCTLTFHPSIKLIKNLIEGGKIGKVSNFSYHSGQYLPDWHPWEGINDFYVSKPETGGCREIVPFELTWINNIFGEVEKIQGYYGKTIELGADIDDVYSFCIKYKMGVYGAVIVDVVSRSAVRQLIINGDKGQITWNWDERKVKLYDAVAKRRVEYFEPEGHSESGYNSNIIEEMYIEEIRAFIECIEKGRQYPNSFEKDYKLLQTLYRLEASN